MITLRKAVDRGHANHGWLKSFHTFSFAEYFDPKFQNFGPLRVINEDFIAEGYGFPMHGHQHMEIITYVISGALEHKDSLGTNSIIKPGEVQKMSAGHGIQHSEFNPNKDAKTHLFQIWIIPNKKVESSYQQKDFTSRLGDGLAMVCSSDGREDTISLEQDAFLYVGKMINGEKLDFPISAGRSLWIQGISGDFVINNITLSGSDAISITEVSNITIQAKSDVHFLLFDLKF